MRASLHRIPALLLLLSVLAGCSGKSLEIDVEPVDSSAATSRQLGWFSRAAIDAWLRWNVYRKTRSGLVALFAIDGQPVYGAAAGWADIEAKTPMTLDTRMRFASMTKPVTAVAAHMLIEEGKLGLDDRVDQYIPEFAEPRVATSQQRNADGNFTTVAAAPAPTIRHLLMFASGIGPGRVADTELGQYWRANGPRNQATGTLGERVAKLGGLPLFEQPGSRWRYGWSADVLARVIEIASDQPFDEFLQQRIFVPLGMRDTRFRYADPHPEEIATVYTQNESGELTAVVNPDNDQYYPEGGSGLISTAQDYLRFSLMLFNGGEYQGVRLLSAMTVRLLSQLHVPDGVLASEGIEGLGWGLGMSVMANAEASVLAGHDGDFGWAGYFGTTFFISPSSGLVGVVLSQNEPGPHSDLPISVYVVQSLAFAGL